MVFGIVILLKTKFFESPKYNGSCQKPIDYECRHIESHKDSYSKPSYECSGKQPECEEEGHKQIYCNADATDFLIDYHAVAKLDCMAAILFEMEKTYPLQKCIFFLKLLNR